MKSEITLSQMPNSTALWAFMKLSNEIASSISFILLPVSAAKSSIATFFVSSIYSAVRCIVVALPPTPHSIRGSCIIIFACRVMNRLPFCPPARSMAAIDAAMPIQTISASSFIAFIASYITNPELTSPPLESMYILILSSGFSF